MPADTFWNRLRTGTPPTYEVLTKGETKGPFRFLEVRKALYEGQISLEDSFRRKGAEKWKSLRAALTRNRLGETIFFGAYAPGFILAGLWLIWFYMPIFQIDRDSASWPFVSGQITFSQLDNSSEDRTKYVPHVGYTYRISSENFFGETIYPECIFGGRKSWAKSVASRHPVGETKVYYSPEHPRLTMLEPGLAPHSFMFFGIGSMLIYTGVLTGIMAWSIYQRPLEEKPSRTNSIRVLFFLATIEIGFVFVCCLP